jgi:hypothetical protein
MDILHRTYAPSLHTSSAKTLFNMQPCSRMDYILSFFVIVALIMVSYRYFKNKSMAEREYMEREYMAEQEYLQHTDNEYLYDMEREREYLDDPEREYLDDPESQ